MKTSATIMLCLILASCVTMKAPINLSVRKDELTKYEQRAREAIASMPAYDPWSGRALPEEHLWHKPLKQQNARIANSCTNVTFVFFTKREFILFFDDPLGRCYPRRYVTFDLDTEELLNCQMGAYLNAPGTKIPPVMETGDMTSDLQNKSVDPISEPARDAHGPRKGSQ